MRMRPVIVLIIFIVIITFIVIIIVIVIISVLLGQGLPQGLLSTRFSAHFFPLFLGSGLLHCLTLLRVPPQFAGRHISDQGPQAPQPPSTEMLST